jgi:hypothetical protein
MNAATAGSLTVANGASAQKIPAETSSTASARRRCAALAGWFSRNAGPSSAGVGRSSCGIVSKAAETVWTTVTPSPVDERLVAPYARKPVRSQPTAG